MVYKRAFDLLPAGWRHWASCRRRYVVPCRSRFVTALNPIVDAGELDGNVAQTGEFEGGGGVAEVGGVDQIGAGGEGQRGGGEQGVAAAEAIDHAIGEGRQVLAAQAGGPIGGAGGLAAAVEGDQTAFLERDEQVPGLRLCE